MSLGRLERSGGRFKASVGKGVLCYPFPTELSIVGISEAYRTRGLTLLPVDLPGITPTGSAAAFNAWRQHHDLPDEAGFRRLLWMVDRFADPIEVDLAWKHYDLQRLWSARRFRRLLLLIDSLPTASHTQEALHTDMTYAKMLEEQVRLAKARGEKENPRSLLPPLRTWTPEVAAITRVTDAVKAVQATIVATNTPKGKTPPSPKPEPRPYTAHQAASEEARMEKSKSIADRVLGRTAENPPSDAD